MAYSIIVGTLVTEGESSWYQGLSANSAQLIAELEALAIPGVRAYSIFGRPGECAGVYPWSGLVPAGEYRHIDELGYEVVISPADQQRILNAILVHVPDSG